LNPVKPSPTQSNQKMGGGPTIQPNCTNPPIHYPSLVKFPSSSIDNRFFRLDNNHMSKHIAFSRRKFLRTNILFATGAGLVGPNIFLNRTKAATGQNPSEFIR